ncbi:hypothetical protein KQX54_018034 [Cotesia glomerata]|uniref:Uncharacterized protein n=1 Tax=Cotesia glomerata TaxID=32391 RepID=A0AAV7HYK8_COTGL|nr:hypothetical protein KQX54_018034 [Cotesia glomerata]
MLYNNTVGKVQSKFFSKTEVQVGSEHYRLGNNSSSFQKGINSVQSCTPSHPKLIILAQTERYIGQVSSSYTNTPILFILDSLQSTVSSWALSRFPEVSSASRTRLPRKRLFNPLSNIGKLEITINAKKAPPGNSELLAQVQVFEESL